MKHPHVVNVMRPSSAEGSRGQIQGRPEVIIKNWPCLVTDISGKEIVQARTVFSEATMKVDGYGDPNKPFAERDYLTGGSIGTRMLNIGTISDKNQNGVELSLLCGERTGG